MKRILPVFFALLPFLCSAQIDTEFWFAAPDLTKGTGAEPRRDSTVYIVVSSLNQPSQVIISQPANLSFPPIIVNLDANDTEVINLGLSLSLLENKPANEVLNKGILIRATRPITAYYEVRSPNNTDIWSLKGKNALGTKFYTPYEDTYGSNQILNGLPYIPGPRAGFIVVASDDNTTVTITPKVDVLGHSANVPFDILLNRGQTYYVEAIDELPSNKPIGTRIESDKPIAVTTKDDMIDIDVSTDSHADVAADQLVSYDYAGLRHVVVKGNLNNNADRVAVLATVDGTEVTIDGDPTPILLDEGEQYVYNMAGNASYIEGTEKLYVFHASGLGEQLAGALIPSLECTGSNQVGFAKPNGTSTFVMCLTIKSGSEDQFELNGDPALVPASAFQTVPGTNGAYVYAKINFLNSQLPNGTHQLTNFSDELFHMGIISRTGSATANYGYFTSFSYLNIGSNSQVCLGDTLILDAGPGKTSYLWSTGEDTQAIEVTQPGEYYVEVFSGSDCSATDTIQVTYYEPPIDLGPNDTICDGTSLLLEVDGNYLFEWQDGSSGNSFEVTEAGIYWLEVSDFQQCTLRDSLEIFTSPRPDPEEIEGELEYCAGETISLTIPTIENAVYRFIDPDGITISGQTLTIENAQEENAGLYQGYFVVDGCESFSDTVEVSINPVPEVNLPSDQSFCVGETYLIEPSPVDGDYNWQDGSSGNSFLATTSGTYWLEVSNEFACTAADTIEIEFRPLPENPLISGDTALCEGETLILSTSAQDGVVYSWFDAAGIPQPAGNELTIENISTSQEGNFSISLELDGCFSDTAFQEVSVNPTPVFNLPADIAICIDAETTIDGPDGFTAYNWSTGDVTPFITVGAGTFSLTVTDEIGCTGSDDITVTASAPAAAFLITPDTVFVPGTLVSFTDNSTEGDFPITDWYWQFGDGSQSTVQNPSHPYTAPGIFTITFAVFDANGCESIVTAQVLSKYEFQIPEGFSPNGDGKNDQLVINGLEEFPGSSLQVFNRWGQVVYENNNYPNNWDGDDVTDGTYFYILKLSNSEAITGSLTIAR